MKGGRASDLTLAHRLRPDPVRQEAIDQRFSVPLGVALP